MTQENDGKTHEAAALTRERVTGDGGGRRGGSSFVPERAQEAGGSLHAGPLQARTRRFPHRLRRVLTSRVVELATTPHGIDRYLTLVNPLWALETRRALLLETHRETQDVTTLVFDPGHGWGPHDAGQHVRIDVDIDGRRRTRYFTVSSRPARDDGLVTLTVKGHPDGFVSRFLQTHARPGLVIEMSEPRGEFVLPYPRPDQLLFVSGGSGITPTMSMLRTLIAERYPGHVTFMHYARTPDDRIFAAELDRIDAEHDEITLVNIYSEGDHTQDELGGFLDAEHLDAVVPDWPRIPAYVCGPPPMLEAAERIWADADAMEHFHIERFTLDLPTEGGGEGRIRLARSDLEFDNDGRPLLVQVEDAGPEPEYGCRMGICKTCTTRKLAGTTQNLASGDVSRDDGEDIQICVSVATGDVELDL